MGWLSSHAKHRRLREGFPSGDRNKEAGLAATPNDVLGFWRNAGPAKWFVKSERFDDAIRLKFEPVHHRAACGEYDTWGHTPEGALALVILLDQSRATSSARRARRSALR